MTRAEGEAKAGDGASTKKHEGIGGRLLDLVIQALPAIAGAVGFLGFVAVLGAAIDWTRFAAAGLPADQAVRVIARPELVATGAVSLILFTLLGLLAVLAAYLLEQHPGSPTGTPWGTVAVAIVELLLVLLFTQAPWWVHALSALGIVAGGIVLAVTAGQLLRVLVPRWRSRARLRALRDAIEDARDALHDARREAAGAEEAGDRARRSGQARSRLLELVLMAWEKPFRARPSGARPTAAELADGSVEGLLEQAGATCDELDRRLRPRAIAEDLRALPDWALLVAGILLVGTVALMVVVDSVRWIGLMLLVVVLLNAGVYGVARASRRFVWYGIAIFLSIPLFGAALGAARTYRFPKLQPVALIRKSSDRAVCGIYVAENDKRVYIARVELKRSDDARAEPGTGRLFWIPVSDVDMIKIGPAQSIGDANGRAPLLADELYADRAEAAPPAVAPTKTQEVTDVGGTRRTTTSEQAVDAGPPRPKPKPHASTASCTHHTLQTPIPDARTGWTKDP